MDPAEKLKSVLLELKADRRRIDEAIQSLESAIANLTHQNNSVIAQNPLPPSRELVRMAVTKLVPGPQGYAEIAYDILVEAGHPMHVKELVPLIGAKKGISKENINGMRSSIESSIHKALDADRWKGKLRRSAPGTYVAVSH